MKAQTSGPCAKARIIGGGVFIPTSGLVQSSTIQSLVIAAPELLALLKRLRHVVYEQLQLDPVDYNYRSICEQADEVITKVEKASRP